MMHKHTKIESIRIGIVQANFNQDLCASMQAACAQALHTLGVDQHRIDSVTVPGALEIPFALAQLARTKRFSALIALGSVIKGETYHFEVVAEQSAAGIMHVSLDTGVPIANGVLTAYTADQAHERAAEKAAACARVAIHMIHTTQDIRSLGNNHEMG